MGIAERRERERQELRDKILDAARGLFAARGYEAVTMREIAARIEYSATVLYKHFADKESLVRELCRKDFDALAARFIEAVSSGDPMERMARAGLVYLEFATENPEHYRLMFMGALPPTPPSEGQREDPTHNAYVFLRALVADLLQAKLLRPDLTNIDLVAQTVWATVHGIAALDLTIPNTEAWLDFRPRHERFVAGLEGVARSVARDPEAAVAALRRVVAVHVKQGWGRAAAGRAGDKGGR
jgi:AcrR family transcriptional regulator